MQMAWMMIWKHGSARPPRDAFADPLEAEEWRGLEWTDQVFAWLLRGRRPAPPPVRCSTPVRRPSPGSSAGTSSPVPR